jgi:hypothetical protein
MYARIPLFTEASVNRQQRILFYDGSDLNDISLAVGDYRYDGYEPTIDVGRYLYVGTELPCNSKFFSVVTPNTDVTVIDKVEVWGGGEWLEVTDVLDETSTTGVSLAKSGLISFELDIDNTTWAAERKSSDIPELVGTSIYNLYWLRLSWTIPVSAGTKIGYVGSKFSDDATLTDFYPDLANSELKTAFEAGKTTWDDQHYMAAESILRDLKRRSIIIRPEQVFDTRQFLEAACHKAAELVYGGLGQAFADARSRAAERYIAAMALTKFGVDADGSGTVDAAEATVSTRYLTR